VLLVTHASALADALDRCRRHCRLVKEQVSSLPVSGAMKPKLWVSLSYTIVPNAVSLMLLGPTAFNAFDDVALFITNGDAMARSGEGREYPSGAFAMGIFRCPAFYWAGRMIIAGRIVTGRRS
jgi:hypothetical protein